MNCLTQTAPKVYRSMPVDKEKVIEKKNAMRHAIFLLACYSPEMTITLSDVVAAFPLLTKTYAFNRIHELLKAGVLRREGIVRDRSICYRVNTVEVTICR